jgi:hypothetical protein
MRESPAEPPLKMRPEQAEGETNGKAETAVS